MKPIYRVALLFLVILLIVVIILFYVNYQNKYIFLILVPIYILGKIFLWDICIFSLFNKVSTKEKDESKD